MVLSTLADPAAQKWFKRPTPSVALCSKRTASAPVRLAWLIPVPMMRHGAAEWAIGTASGPEGDVVILCFLSPVSVDVPAGTPVPRRQLVAAQRLGVGATGSAATARFVLEEEHMMLVGVDGERAVRSGTYDVVFDSGVSNISARVVI